MLEQINLNDYIIKLKNDKQLFYKLIYSLNLVKLKILKTYIKTYLKTRFIHLFKSTSVATILFNKNLDNSFYLYMDYWGLNKLTIKNRYLLPLIVNYLTN